MADRPHTSVLNGTGKGLKQGTAAFFYIFPNSSFIMTLLLDTMQLKHHKIYQERRKERNIYIYTHIHTHTYIHKYTYTLHSLIKVERQLSLPGSRLELHDSPPRATRFSRYK
jgi:hypothetical protein